ncbi:MAG TPA: NADH-quinone oxidoreductase subunit C [Dongiaceae bacterium]|nr:NADH-quinone oxidoreductase subunit C [Dongiaceae bacterium]
MTKLANADANVVVEQLRNWNNEAVSQVDEHRGETTIVVPHALLRVAAQQCKQNPALDFNLLSDATCVDRFPVEPRFELNYHLVSIARGARIRLRTSVSLQQPVIDSLYPVWPGASWLEREIFDLFGIRFEGHPDLRRILLPEEFEGFPLRRDFPVEGKR